MSVQTKMRFLLSVKSPFYPITSNTFISIFSYNIIINYFFIVRIEEIVRWRAQFSQNIWTIRNVL